jgi:hypothetical protein
MFRFTLIYSRTAPYAEKFSRIVTVLNEIKNQWNINYDLKETEDLQDDEINLFRTQVRGIMPQSRGKIVSLRGKILPLSHSKKLNTENTPVLILYEDESPKQVYPHMLGEDYITVEDGLSRILEKGTIENEVEGLVERPLQRLLANNPAMFEVDASCLGVEVDVGVGVADLVLEGSDKRSIIIEIKVHADDSTIGQISRISEGYLAKERIDPKNVRKVIICVTYGKTLVEACLGANIELYKLGFHRII